MKIEAKRLTDLNIARAGHALFYANGELTVAGGHTDGFVPTPTAEYLKDGQWHQMPMVYCHDFGFHTVLRNGKVLLGGGCAEPIGIGQTFLAELYDPTSHTFVGFNSMEHKRTGASALEIDSGKVVISGNWYHQDAIELFDSMTQRFTHVRKLGTQRAIPLILQIAPDDALIFGSNSIYGDTLKSAYVYQLKGDSIHIPLLETWHPINTSRYAGCIGKYTYLIPVSNDRGEMAVMQVKEGKFSLMPTVCPVPTKALGKEIEYTSDFIVDQKVSRAYLLGANRDFHQNPGKPIQYFILAVDYAEVTKGKAATQTLYYPQLINEAIDSSPVLTPEGNLVVAGGFLNGSNFTPSKAVWLFPVGMSEETATASDANLWLWLIPLIILAIALLAYLFINKRHPTASIPEEHNYNALLMERIRKLMEEEKLYLNPDLKTMNIADALGIHRNAVSDVINSQTGGTFTQFVSNYRIEHAKALLHQNPNMKLSSVSSESGFAHEQTFFRTFKATTGKTPKEWIQTID